MKSEQTALTAIETVACSRCGGTGQCSYCSMYGSTCFKCGGGKRVYTKRGRAAHNWLVALRSKPIETVQVGEVVRMHFGMTGNILAWATVTKSAADTTNHQNGWVLEAKNSKLGEVGYHTTRGEMIRMAQTAEQKVATLKQALEFQATLGKNGQPLKRVKKAAA